MKKFLRLFSATHIWVLVLQITGLVQYAKKNGMPSDQIDLDPNHPQWLKRQRGDPFFICGPNDIEGFLYLGERQLDETRKGPQESMIRKLIKHGGYCIYMQIVRAHGGDGTKEEDKLTQNPFVDSDPSKGVDYDIFDQ
tara:strand:- start:1117 stop:1530 length:414 start_codon:yes stop_codon:yes gene_type:complete